MNFLKKVGIAAALFGAVTVANAQQIYTTKAAAILGTSSSDVAATAMTLDVVLPQDAAITATKTSLAATAAASKWFVDGLTATLAADTSKLGKVGTVKVETNLPRWDVEIKSPNALTLKSDGGANFLQCQKGGAKADAKLQIFGCIHNVATNAKCSDASPNKFTALGPIPAAGIKLSSKIESKNGTGKVYSPIDMTAATATVPKTATFVLYAGVDCAFGNLLNEVPANGNTFSETLTLSLIAGW